MASDAQPRVVSDLQAETQAAEDLKKCGRCEEMVADYIHKNKGRCKLNAKITPIFYCLPCNRNMQKVHAILKNNSLVVQVDDGPARKRKHEELSKNTLNADVPRLLTNSATEYDQRTNHDQFEKKSVWLDEIDLKDKYNNKPEQLKNIMETADTMVHPLRKATLYEDFDFVRTEREGYQILSEGRKEQSQETKAKKAKVKKEPADQQLAPAHAPEEVSKFKPLTDKQKRVLQELKQSVLQQKSVTLEASIKKAKDTKYVDYIPSKVVAAAESDYHGLTATINSVAMALEEGWAGVASDLQRDIKNALESSNASTSRLDVYVEQADGVIG